MILIDLNQTLIAGLMAQIQGQKNLKLEENLVRHMVLNIIRSHMKHFRHKYGEVILCSDNRNYWRKQIFPQYKANRKKVRETSDFDWQVFHDLMNKIKGELKEYFPYKFLEIDGAEADDIIGTLVPIHSAHQAVLIMSSDGDFLQLQKYPNVLQYNPSLKKFLKSETPYDDLKMKIITGDSGDGIPNILSPDDTFVTGTRQKVMTKASLEKFMAADPVEYATIPYTGFSRNKTLIDLTQIPVEVQTRIIDKYNETVPATRKNLLNYFMENRLSALIEVIEEF